MRLWAEMVDPIISKIIVERREGSSPSRRTYYGN